MAARLTDQPTPKALGTTILGSSGAHRLRLILAGEGVLKS
jgi:hypothetical protein